MIKYFFFPVNNEVISHFLWTHDILGNNISFQNNESGYHDDLGGR